MKMHFYPIQSEPFPEPDSQQPLFPLSLSRLGVVPESLPANQIRIISSHFHSDSQQFHFSLPRPACWDTVVWQSCLKAPNCLHKTCSLDQIITVRQECSDRTDNKTGEETTGNSNSRRGRQRERQWETSRQFPSPVSLTALLLAHMKHMKGRRRGVEGLSTQRQVSLTVSHR